MTGPAHSVPEGSGEEVKVLSFPAGVVAVYSASSPDKSPTDNEDAYTAIPLAGGALVLALADGAGGHNDGAAASRIAIESIEGALADSGELPRRAAIINGFENAHHKIGKRRPGAATTLIVAEIAERSARFCHVGDSGAMVLGGRGRVKHRTLFHSPTGYALEAGLMSETDAMISDERHLVSNILGMTTMSVEVGTPSPLALRDSIVIASDGLFDNLLTEEIVEAARGCAPEVACYALADAARMRMCSNIPGRPGKPDDLTVMVYRQT